MLLNTIVGLPIFLEAPIGTQPAKNKQTNSQELVYGMLRGIKNSMIEELARLFWANRHGDDPKRSKQIESLQTALTKIDEVGKALGYKKVELTPEAQGYYKEALRKLAIKKVQLDEEIPRVAWAARTNGVPGAAEAAVGALNRLKVTIGQMEELFNSALGN